jgi:ribonuclease-3
MDSGYEPAKAFIDKHLLSFADKLIAKGGLVDAKSLFQEKAQEKVGVTPAYKSLKETGPDHDKFFTVGVYLNKELVAQGDGKSKQEAEQSAAQKALDTKSWN